MHFESTPKTTDPSTVQAKDYIWKGNPYTTLRSLEAAARAKRQKLQFQKNTSATRGNSADVDL